MVRVCEKYFKLLVCGDDLTKVSSAEKLRAKLRNTILADLRITRPGKVLFQCLLQHDIDEHTIGEDFHSTQIMKAVINKYLTIRL